MFNPEFINSECRSSFRMSTLVDNLLKIKNDNYSIINDDLFLSFCYDIELKSLEVYDYTKRFLKAGEKIGLFKNIPCKKECIEFNYDFCRDIPNNILNEKEKMHENLSFIYLHKMEEKCDISFLYKVLDSNLGYLSKKEIIFMYYYLKFGSFSDKNLAIEKIINIIKKIREKNSIDSVSFIIKESLLIKDNQSNVFLEIFKIFENNDFEYLSTAEVKLLNDKLLKDFEIKINNKKEYNNLSDYINTFFNYLRSTNLFIVEKNENLKNKENCVKINYKEKERFSFINDFSYEEREELLQNGEWSEYYYTKNKSYSINVKESSENPSINRKKFREEMDTSKCFFDNMYIHNYVKDENGNTLAIDLHHVIPMHNQQHFLNKYNVDIDVKKNLVAVCKNCHAYLHSKVDDYLDILYEDKKNNLNELTANEEVSLSKFKSFY